MSSSTTTQQDSQITTKHLLEHGILKPGTKFYFGKHCATLNRKGQLEFQWKDLQLTATDPSDFTIWFGDTEKRGWEYVVDANDVPLMEYKKRLNSISAVEKQADEEKEEFSDLDIALLQLHKRKRKSNESREKVGGKKSSGVEKKRKSGKSVSKDDEKILKESNNERRKSARKKVEKDQTVKKLKKENTDEMDTGTIVLRRERQTTITKRKGMLAQKRALEEKGISVSDDDTPRLKVKRKRPNEPVLVRNVTHGRGYLPPGIQPAQLADRDLYYNETVLLFSRNTWVQFCGMLLYENLMQKAER